TNRFNEQITAYDKMGNILGLKRYGQMAASSYGLIDNLTLTYNGNQLQAIKDVATSSVYGNGTEFKDNSNQTVEYVYDKNGNLTKDLNKNISSIRYNILNLPNQVIFAGGNSVLYEYAADGTKLRTVHKTGATTLTTDYCGNAIYENGVLKMLLNEAGYVSFPDKKNHFYIKDHQGNTRVVADKDGNVEETNAYYPFGGTFTSTNNVQPFKYNGKELDQKNGLNWYDYGARHYDAAIGRFVTLDPLAESFYYANPYTYCLNNPHNRVDPSGMASRYNWERQRYEDENGNEVSWESVRQEYRIDEDPTYEISIPDDPPSKMEVDGITGAARKPTAIEIANSKKEATIAPAIPWWLVGSEIIGSSVSRFLGPISMIFILQSDTEQSKVYVDEASKKKKVSSAEADYGEPSAEHRQARPSTKDIHQKGRKRVQRDRGGEKGDARRTRNK
ncbi:RHS repeat-associated core domain-containing protein, partial [Bacteroides sp.]|uniref:RHS repeat domain-containing protein n=1 Tax=Bacteroides sp. TaxID=29523 RepID=UPI00263764B5